MDGKVQRAKLREEPALSRTRLSFSFLGICKAAKIFLFALAQDYMVQFQRSLVVITSSLLQLSPAFLCMVPDLFIPGTGILTFLIEGNF